MIRRTPTVRPKGDSLQELARQMRGALHKGDTHATALLVVTVSTLVDHVLRLSDKTQDVTLPTA